MSVTGEILLTQRVREREDGDTKIPLPGAAALKLKSAARGTKQGP